MTRRNSSDQFSQILVRSQGSISIDLRLIEAVTIFFMLSSDLRILDTNLLRHGRVLNICVGIHS